MVDTPYFIISGHIDHQNLYEIHRSGEGRVAWSHHLLMAHRIVDLLNQQEQDTIEKVIAGEGDL
jgi:hypothetical protein